MMLSNNQTSMPSRITIDIKRRNILRHCSEQNIVDIKTVSKTILILSLLKLADICLMYSFINKAQGISSMLSLIKTHVRQLRCLFAALYYNVFNL